MNMLNLMQRSINAVITKLLCLKEENVDYINGADSLPPPLSKEDEQKLLNCLKPKKKPESCLSFTI